MEFTPYTKKLVAVLNEKAEPGKVMNALAHMAVGLGGSVSDREDLRLQTYADADHGKHPHISDIPFIILKGTSGQIRNLRKAAIESGVHHTDFTTTMTGGTYVEQHERTARTKEEDLEYLGICLFGNWETVSLLTKKFSLWK